ncbi:C40 family peptidase [Oceanobacillus bengalensis]|uniref:NlpC/P60 family protein n=2 Tax=Oceanobacillus bengalensis TaxID=1435466 RepID=A0A494YZB7_9BACI|nr:C40 family peptidase [Oceanobacillus bengalensis]RKQ15347.1 NlpC/P60 family protein [Oceanobacillus bengalensis]
MFKQTFDLFSKEIWITAVQVGTVWTNPQSIREIDREGTMMPTDIDHWITSLSYEDSLALCDENRIQTQTLFGEPVIVTEIKGDFAHVIIPSQPSKKDERGYPGWMPLAQIKKVKKQEWIKPQTAAVTIDKAWLEMFDAEKEMKLSYLTLLPVENIHHDRVEVITPLGNRFLSKEDVSIFPTKEGLSCGEAQDIVKSVERFVGLQYFWGGMSAFGYDCSGLAYAAHKANGYLIPRDAGDQAKAGVEVPLTDIKKGDLLFFAYKAGKGSIHHVGIYEGKGKMLHAPQTGKGVESTMIAGTKYEKELCAARRYAR